ncbi:MAG: cytochrome d ubiquinol oxidase subunit II [Sphingomonadaceae bacterium]|nr:cytochrome d ubiquinol oxidase subunit II [Sphingomonadaceae bacterium]
MSHINYDLTTLWAGIIAAALFFYVVMDGFDLGIGLIFPFFEDKAQRDAAMNSVAPVWDGNETWLVLGGGGLFAAFPLAYAVIMPALYPLVIAMLLGLILRGVSFEFRWRARNQERANRWDAGFFAGSLIATLAQGVMLGAILSGIRVSGRAYVGGWWDWLTPFSVLTGISLVAGYVLLGSTWLVLKTEGPINARARRIAFIALAGTMVAIGAVSLATLTLSGRYLDRWLSWPNILWVAPVPILVVVAGWVVWDHLRRLQDRWPFPAALAIFFLCFTGLGISIYPMMVPPSISIYAAAAPEKSQMFMLVGVAVLLPLILGYTAWSYYVFRGKVASDAGYH